MALLCIMSTMFGAKLLIVGTSTPLVLRMIEKQIADNIVGIQTAGICMACVGEP